jgi:RNA polymerase sigma factor (sigma-70 family)
MTLEPRRFETTQWSLVLRAGGESSEARHALNTLCTKYWYPLYAYVRRQGHEAEDARDLTQAFFARLLERQDVQHARRERGRFRSYLLASMKHFLLNDAERRRALKRGGPMFQSLPIDAAESRYRGEPIDTCTPEIAFDRRWACSLLDCVLNRLRAEWIDAGRGAEFERLKVCLTGDSADGGYRALARELGMSEGAVKVAAHRLRRSYRRLLRAEIAETVLTEDAVEQEIQHLFRALAAR